MSHAITFDTLEYVKKLRKAGVAEKQAEAQAEALAELVNDQVVTRQYFDLRMRELEINLTLRLGGMLVAGIAIVAALVKLL